MLVDVAKSLPPGMALELRCGEGGDAVCRAGIGLRVTAVDVSDTALERASAHAAASTSSGTTWPGAYLREEVDGAKGRRK